MADAAATALTLLNASSVIFDRKWSTHLPVIGTVSVELRILYTGSKFTFSITVQVAGKTFNWSKDVSGNISIPIKLVDDFGLEVDIAGWAVSSHQLSFDLLIKITGPFGLSVTLFHQRVNIPLPSQTEIEALASLDYSKAEHASAFMTAAAYAPVFLAEERGLGGQESFTEFGGIDGGVEIKNPRVQGGQFCCDVRIYAKALGNKFDHTFTNVCVNVTTCVTVFSGGLAGFNVSLDLCYHDSQHPNQACAYLKASIGPFSKTWDQCINA